MSDDNKKLKSHIYYVKNKEKILLRVRNYYQNNKERIKTKYRKYPIENPYKVTVSHRQNLSKSATGRKHTEETKRKISTIKIGRPFSIEARKSMKEKAVRGERHYMWIKDRTKVKISDRILHDPLQKQWTRNVKDRDNWTCKIADTSCSGKLEAHHILPWSKFPELRYQINNGITLCQHHHPRKMEEVAKLSPFFQQLVASSD